jgi:hypothetical protein
MARAVPALNGIDQLIQYTDLNRNFIYSRFSGQSRGVFFADTRPDSG